MQPRTRVATVWFALLSLVCVNSCGGGGGGNAGGGSPSTPSTPSAPAPVLTTINVSLGSGTLQPGGTTAASVSGLDQNNAPIATGAISWSSGAATVATVSNSGVVTALTPGTAGIIAAAGGRQGSAQLTVIPTPVSSVTVTPANASLIVNATQQFAAATLDASGAVLPGRAVTWTSADPTRVSVSASGLATAVAVGITTLTATSEGRSGTATVAALAPPVAVCEQLRPIVVGQNVSSALTTNDCRLSDGSFVQKFELRIAAQTAVQIDMTSSAVDAYLLLQDATTGAILDQDDDDGGQSNARIARLLQPGRYLIYANTFNANATGAYQLTVQQTSSACFTPSAIAVPAIVNGALRTSSCKLPDGSFTDLYALNVTTRTTVQLALSSNVFDAFVRVFSESGALQGENDDGANSTDSRLEITLDPGRYLVLATSFERGALGPYTLDVRSFANPCAVSRSLGAGAAVSSALGPSDCILDGGYFAQNWGLTLTGTTQLRIDMTSADMDVYLLLMNATTKAVLFEDDDSGGNSNARLVASVPAGQYIVVATTYDPGVSGRYQLALGQPVATPIAITVNLPTLALQPGQTQNLIASVTNTSNTAVTWQSSAPTVATVSTAGQVRAVAPGTATISATALADPLRVATSRVTVSASTGGAPNLDIAAAYITQAVQNLENRIPLVANRRALLRVFLRGSQSGLASTGVRVRLYDGATLTATLMASAAPRTSVDEACCAAEFMLTDAQVRSGLAFLADVDPANVVAENNETDNSFPVSGVPQALTVQTVPDLRVVMVPVRFTKNGRVGQPTQAMLNHTRAIWPVATLITSAAATFNTDLPPLVSDDRNGSWSELLRQLEVKRRLEASTSYYYGVLNVDYTSGITGLAYITGRSGLGIDFSFGPGTSYASENMAHELGHNFGRTHTPCFTGNNRPANPDPQYPFTNGSIGVFGVDLFGTTIGRYGPTAPDIMGYCDDGWASPYSWSAVSVYRAAGAARITQPAKAAIVVSGLIRNGAIRVEPAFSGIASPTVDDPSGQYVAEALDAAGKRLVSIRFSPLETDHADAASRMFSVALPLSDAEQALVATLVVRDVKGASPSARRSRGASMAGSRAEKVSVISARSVGSSDVELTWKRDDISAIAVRDRRTGEIIAFGSLGTLNMSESSLGAVEFLVSDGVTSRVQPASALVRRAP